MLASALLVAGLFVPGPIDAEWLLLPTQNPLSVEALATISAGDLSNLSLAVYGIQRDRPAAILVRRYRRIRIGRPRPGPVGRRGRHCAGRAVPGAAPCRRHHPERGRRRALDGVGSCRPRCCRSRSGSRSCATACTTSIGSSAARSPRPCHGSPRGGCSATRDRLHAPPSSGSRRARRSRSPRPRWSPRRCFSRCAAVQRAVDRRFDRSSRRTATAPPRRSPSGCGRSSMSTSSTAISRRRSRWSVRPSAQGLWLRVGAK